MEFFHAFESPKQRAPNSQVCLSTSMYISLRGNFVILLEEGIGCKLGILVVNLIGPPLGEASRYASEGFPDKVY